MGNILRSQRRRKQREDQKEKNKLIYGNTKGREVDRDARRKGAGMPK